MPTAESMLPGRILLAGAPEDCLRATEALAARGLSPSLPLPDVLLDRALATTAWPEGVVGVAVADGGVGWRSDSVAASSAAFAAAGVVGVVVATVADDEEADTLRAAGAAAVVEARSPSGRAGAGLLALAVRSAALGPSARKADRDELQRARDALRESRERLQAALDGAGVGTFRWDIRTDELEWDENLDRLFGLDPGTTVRSLERFIQRVHPAERQQVIDGCRRCATEGADFDMEFRVVTPDGQERWLADKGTTYVVDGRPAYMTGMCIDITARKQTQQALSDSEERFRTLADHISQLAWIADRSGNITWYNRRWFDYTGTTLQEVEGWGWRRVHHPAHVDRVVEKIARCFETGEPWEDTFPLRGRDGEYRWFLSRAVPIRDEHGALVRWFGTNTDVTDQRSVEQALRRREHELRTLTDNSPDVLTRFDRQFRHVYVSGAIERIAGRPREEFLGRTNRELGMPAVLCDQWEAALQTTFDTGQPQAIEFLFRSPTGDKSFTAKLVPEFGAEGSVEFVIGVTHERTAEYVAKLALEDSNRRKDEFLATLAHELRNPLAPIRTGLLVLKRVRDAERVDRVVEMMDRQLSHMVRLIDDLLDVSRISSGKVALRIEHVALRPLVEMALEATRPALEAGRHQVQVRWPDDSVYVNGDATRISQVFSNLLTNAAKYTPDGGQISMETDVDGAEVTVAVRDSGVGIPAELLDEVFTMFAQVDRTLERAQGGLGIGLALVRRLVEMHGGTVTARSPGLGFGSTFTVRLPLARPGTAPGPAPAHPADGELGPPRRVVVVDDNTDAAESLAALLSLQGHEVRVAGSGPQALQLATDWSPDAAFIDIGLPGMSGHEVARRWRALPLARQPLLIALTGWGTERDKRLSAQAGFDEHLTKPVDPERVFALLRTVSGGEVGNGGPSA